MWQGQGAIPRSKRKVKNSWFLTALCQTEPFALPFPLVSRLFSGRTVCIPWHGTVVEERLVFWELGLPWSSQPLLTPPILVLAHPTKQQRFGVIGSEWETNLLYSVLFHGEELKPVVWVVPETGDLNPIFDQWLWLSCVERGPKPWCRCVGKSTLSKVAKMFWFLFFYYQTKQLLTVKCKHRQLCRGLAGFAQGMSAGDAAFLGQVWCLNTALSSALYQPWLERFCPSLLSMSCLDRLGKKIVSCKHKRMKKKIFGNHCYRVSVVKFS